MVQNASEWEAVFPVKVEDLRFGNPSLLIDRRR